MVAQTHEATPIIEAGLQRAQGILSDWVGAHDAAPGIQKHHALRHRRHDLLQLRRRLPKPRSLLLNLAEQHLPFRPRRARRR